MIETVKVERFYELGGFRVWYFVHENRVHVERTSDDRIDKLTGNRRDEVLNFHVSEIDKLKEILDGISRGI